MAAPSASRDGHVLDEDRAAALGAAHHGVAPASDDAAVYVLQVSRHGHLLDRERDLAVLDPIARGAARVVAGDEVDAVAEQLGDEEAAPEFFQHAAQVRARRLQNEVVVAACAAGAPEAELARRV